MNSSSIDVLKVFQHSIQKTCVFIRHQTYNDSATDQLESQLKEARLERGGQSEGGSASQHQTIMSNQHKIIANE
jgi:hypothetical protein